MQSPAPPAPLQAQGQVGKDDHLWRAGISVCRVAAAAGHVSTPPAPAHSTAATPYNPCQQQQPTVVGVVLQRVGHGGVGVGEGAVVVHGQAAAAVDEAHRGAHLWGGDGREEEG